MCGPGCPRARAIREACEEGARSGSAGRSPGPESARRLRVAWLFVRPTHHFARASPTSPTVSSGYPSAPTHRRARARPAHPAASCGVCGWMGRSRAGKDGSIGQRAVDNPHDRNPDESQDPASIPSNAALDARVRGQFGMCVTRDLDPAVQVDHLDRRVRDDSALRGCSFAQNTILREHHPHPPPFRVDIRPPQHTVVRGLDPRIQRRAAVPAAGLPGQARQRRKYRAKSGGHSPRPKS